VLKLRTARQRIRQRAGRCEGRKPFGTRPGEAESLALMRRLRRKLPGGKRASFADIADTLNAKGIPTRTGAPWRARTVHGILGRRSGKAAYPSRDTAVLPTESVIA